MEEFLTDVKILRERARENIEKGPVTDAYGADLDRVIYVLNQALATEIVCVLRYKRHYFTADGLNAQSAADEFLEHASEEQDHADQIAEIDLNPVIVHEAGQGLSVVDALIVKT